MNRRQHTQDLPSQQSMRAGHKVRRFRGNQEPHHVRTVRTQTPKRSAA